MKKILISVFMLSFLVTGTAFCHYSWIDFDNFFPLPGEEVRVFLCNGHYFPKSTFAIKDRLISDAKIISYDGSISTFTTTSEKKIRSGSVVFDGTGTYTAAFLLVKPPMKEPLTCAKSIITVGNITEKEFSYELGHIFEIVPQKAISSLKPKDSLPLKLIYRDKPLKSTLIVTVKVYDSRSKKNFTLRTKDDGTAVLKIKKAGKYLVTAEYKGKGCSLTFYVKQD